MNTSPASTRLVVTDVVAISLLSAVALSPFADVFDGPHWVVAAAGGLGLGLVIAFVSRQRQWGVWFTALASLVALLVLGPALAVPQRVVAVVVPTPRALRDLLVGVIDSWRNALTLQTPLGTEHHVLVVPLLVGFLAALAMGIFLWRSRWPSIAAFGIVALFVAAASFGSRTAEFPIGRGLLLTLAVIVWVRWRDLRDVRTSWPRRIGLTSAVVAAASLIGWGLTAATAGDPDRQVLRDHVDPPMQRLDFKSPLSKYRSYYKDHERQELFTIEGLPDGARVRLATMDQFDGIVWNVSTVERTTGSSAFVGVRPSTGSDPIRVTIAEHYAGPWVPTIGATSGVTLVDDASDGATRQLLFNGETGAVAQIGDVRPGDVYEIDWEQVPALAPEPTEGADREIVFAHSAVRLPQLDKLVQTWVAEAGATADVEVIRTIENKLKDGFFSNGLIDDAFPTPSGHGAKRIADLVADPTRMIGNDEQYASAMALELQALGMPARVVLGFESDAGPRIVGADIAAWVEVKLAKSGWQAFDPTPPEDNRPSVISEDPEPVSQPNVVQPPVLPNEPDQFVGTPPDGAGKDLQEKLWDFLALLLGYVVTAVKIVALLAPVWLVVLAKRIRHRRRRAAADPVQRVAGGWREVVDRARDLGARTPASLTRHESGMVLTERYQQVELMSLATVADRHVFGPVTPSVDEVDEYWADVDTALKRMRKAVPWWRRPLATISPASIPWRSVRDGALARGRGFAGRLARTKVGRTTVDASRRGTSIVRVRVEESRLNRKGRG